MDSKASKDHNQERFPFRRNPTILSPRAKCRHRNLTMQDELTEPDNLWNATHGRVDSRCVWSLHDRCECAVMSIHGV
eukprot:4800190-Amphidinium_carterae.2